MFWRTLIMALREIRRNAMRSSLTALGIVIGVAAVVCMVSLGQAATARVTSDISVLGDNLLIISPGMERRGATNVASSAFELADAEALAKLSSLRLVAPTVVRRLLVVYNEQNWSTDVNGVTEPFYEVRNYEIALGRGFSQSEEQGGAAVCVLGETVVEKLLGAQPPIGETIRVGRLSCTIVGVLKSKGSGSFGNDQDDFILMPLVTVQRRIAGNRDLSLIFASASDRQSAGYAKAQVEDLLRERRRILPGAESNFSVQDMEEITKTLGVITGVLTALLAAIASISLLVGGIGIMNIMLVSVTERTREIGIRLAIGALGRDVLFQFLVEAIVLSTLGGIVGIALGLLGSLAATSALKLPFIIVPWVILVALGFSMAVGISFGYFPARKAARLNPIDALRHE